MKHRLFVLALLALAAAWLPQPVTAAPELPALLPDSALVVLSVKNFPELRRKWDKHPLAQIWRDPQVVQIFTPLRQELKMDQWEEQVKTSTGHSLDELLGIAQGQVALAILDAPFLSPDKAAAKPAPGKNGAKNETPDPAFVLLADIGSDANNAKLLTELLSIEKKTADGSVDSSRRKRTETVAGVTVHVEEKTANGQNAIDGVWTIHKGLFLASNQMGVVESTLGAIEKGRVANPLSEAPVFSQVGRQVRGSDAFAFVNFRTIVPPLMDLLSDAMAPKPGAPQAPMGNANFPALEAALAADVLQSAYAAWFLAADNTRIDLGLNYSDRRGLVRLIDYGRRPVELPALFPADCLEVGVTTLDLGAYWDDLKDIAFNIHPMVAFMVGGALQNVKQRAQVDLERDLLANLGDEISWCSAFQAPAKPGDSPSLAKIDQVYLLKLRNVQAVQTAIAGLVNMATPPAQPGQPPAPSFFTEETYLGIPVRSSRNAIGGGPGNKSGKYLHYAFVREYLLISLGSPELLRRNIQVLTSGRGENPWTKPAVSRALKTLPEGPWMLQASDLSKALTGVISVLDEVQKQRLTANGKPLMRLDGVQDPQLFSKYFDIGVGAAYHTNDGLYYRYVAFHKTQPQ